LANQVFFFFFEGSIGCLIHKGHAVKKNTILCWYSKWKNNLVKWTGLPASL